MNRRYRKDIPKCIGKHNHLWKKGENKYHESGICARCGFDQFTNTYRSKPNHKDTGIEENDN